MSTKKPVLKNTKDVVASAVVEAAKVESSKQESLKPEVTKTDVSKAREKKQQEAMNGLAFLQRVTAGAVKALGSEAVHSGADSDLGEPKMFIPSGVPDLDEVLDRGQRGWPTGRIVEIYGASATCKTGLGYAVISQAQRMGGAGVLIPCEGNVDGYLFEQYKINPEGLTIIDSNVVETVFEQIYSIVKAAIETALEYPLVIVLDSIAGLCTKDELKDPNMSKDRAAQIRAFLVSKATRKIGALIPQTNVLLFLINQVRDPGEINAKAKPVGGQSIAFYASVRLRVEHTQNGKLWRQSGGKKYVKGIQLRITAEKNRLARPFQQAEFFLDFETGPQPSLKKKASDVEDSEEGGQDDQDDDF